MKKVFRIENLDCANCAAKLERAIQKVNGVISASVSFMSAKLTLEASDNVFDEVVEEVKRVAKKLEPDWIIK